MIIPITDFKISEKISEIVDKIDDPYRVYFAFTFMALHDSKELVYQRGTQRAHFNDTFLVITDKHKEKIKEECSLPDKELLQKAFARHCSAMHFRGNSGRDQKIENFF